MTRSSTIDGLLAEFGMPAGHRASEHPCEGAKFHSPTPLVTFPYPLGDGNEVYLCPTCGTNLDNYLHLNRVARDRFTWPVRREFGNQIRALADRASSPSPE